MLRPLQADSLVSKETQGEVCQHTLDNEMSCDAGKDFGRSFKGHAVMPVPCSDVNRAADEAQRHPRCLLLERPRRNVRLDRGISRITISTRLALTM